MGADACVLVGQPRIDLETGPPTPSERGNEQSSSTHSFTTIPRYPRMQRSQYGGICLEGASPMWPGGSVSSSTPTRGPTGLKTQILVIALIRDRPVGRQPSVAVSYDSQTWKRGRGEQRPNSRLTPAVFRLQGCHAESSGFRKLGFR